MKTFKKLCVLFVFFFQLNLIQSQNSLEIEANYALTSEKLVSHNKIAVSYTHLTLPTIYSV